MADWRLVSAMTDGLLRFASLAMLPLALTACGQSATDGSTAPANDSAPAAAIDEAAPAPPPGNADASGPSVLPDRFRGRWDASAAACAGPRGEMRLDVEPDQLRFYESMARVEAVRRAAGGSVQVDLAFEGEGERWIETRMLRLLPDGRLSVETADGPADRVRCG